MRMRPATKQSNFYMHLYHDPCRMIAETSFPHGTTRKVASDVQRRQSKSLGALRWSGCEVGLCERVDDDRLAFRGRGDAGMPTSAPVVR